MIRRTKSENSIDKLETKVKDWETFQKRVAEVVPQIESEKSKIPIEDKPTALWHMYRTEIKYATTRAEHHENLRILVRSYAKRHKIPIQFTFWDEPCDTSKLRKHKYDNVESTS